jgi:hypothetical protein
MIALVSVANRVRAMGSPELPSLGSRGPRRQSVDYAWCGEEERSTKDSGREDRLAGRIREGMTKESAGCRGDVQRQMRAAAVDLAGQRGRFRAQARRPRSPC